MIGYRIAAGDDCAQSETFCYIGATDKGTVIPAADRRPAGEASADLMDGMPFALADHRGEIVLVNFWGTSCGPCVVETPELDEVYRAHVDQGVLFVGVAVRDVEAHTRSFVEQNKISYPIIADFNAKTALLGALLAER